MALKTFITGQPGVGKTTCIRRVVEALSSRGIKVGGLVTQEMRGASGRTGFRVQDLLTGEVGILAAIGQPGPRVGKYGVNVPELERIGVAAIEQASSLAQMIVIDEIGPMELCSEKFAPAVRRALLSPKPVLGAVHRSARDPLIDYIRSRTDIRVITIVPPNRDLIAAQLVHEYSEALRA